MKKLITDYNMWFFAAVMCLVVWAFNDNGSLWAVFAGASVFFGIDAKKKDN